MRVRLGLALGLLLPLFGCTAFPVIEAGVCGNAVKEEDEDCDTFDIDGHVCRPPGIVGECRFDCSNGADPRIACPSHMGCGADGICREPKGTFATGINFAPGTSSWLTTADIDGDHRLDVISTEAADNLRQARFRVHYFDADAKLAETRTFPRVVTRPVARRLTLDEADDLVFSNGSIGMVPGRRDREWIPAAFSSYALPGTHLRAVPLRAEGVSNAIGLAIFSHLEEGPGVYVPSLDDRELLFRYRLDLPFENLAAEPISAELVTGAESPCSEVVFAFIGDDSVRVLDLCERGTVRFENEIAWRDKPIEQVVRLPGGVPVTTAPQTVDYDGDGQLDILVGSGYETFVALNHDGQLEAEASKVTLFSHEDNETFALSPPLAAHDLTGDGVVDFVMATGILASYTSLVDGTLGYVETYRNFAEPWTMAVVADLNGNGLPDVIAGSQGTPGLAFLSGTGGLFQNPTPLSTLGPLRSLSVGDFDGDRVFDVGYVQSGPTSEDDTLAIAFGQRDTFPMLGSRIAQVSRVQQLGSATQRGGSSLFTVSQDELGDVTRSKFTIFDGSPDRLPFAPYALVTFSVNRSLDSSLARVLAAGAFTAPGANDLFALGGDEFDPKLWSMWLVPDIGASEKPPQLLEPDAVPEDAQGLTLNEQSGQLSAAATAADLEDDDFDEALVLLQKGFAGEGCYLLIYDLDAAASLATSKGVLTFDEPCPEPELATADMNADGALDVLALIGDPKLGPRQLRVLFNDKTGGFSLEDTLLLGPEGHDVRGFSAFSRPGRLAFVTDDGLYEANVRGTGKSPKLSKLRDFVDARSVVVTNPDGDNVEDLAVADAAGVWLLRAELR